MEIQKEKILESWDYFVPVPCLSRTKYILLIVFLSVGCFIISIDGQFVFDDSEAIVNNKDVKLTTPIGELFYNDFWGTRMNHSQSHKSYRPITILSFRFNAWLNNGILSPYQFRLVNVLLHCTVCLLSKNVFELLMGGNCCKAANLCAIIFSIHPIHTEAVAGIVGRAELLCAVFSFISLILYNKAVNSVRYFYNICYALLSAIFVSLAMLSKEQGITMLGICFIYDVWVVNRLNVVKYVLSFFGKNNFTLHDEKLSVDHKRVTSDRFLCNKNNHKNECSGVKNTNNDYRLNKNNLFIIYMLVLRFIIILTTGLLLFYVRWKIMAGSPPTFQKFDNLAASADSFIIRVINYNYIYALNSWLLLCPVWLCFDWSMGCVPLITHTNDIRILFTILFWCIIILLFYRSLFFVDNKTNRSIIMALSFMIMSFLPASNLFFKVGFVIAERVLYLPSVGYCIIITVCVRYFLQYLMKNLTRHQLLSTRVTVIIFWLLVVCIFITRSILRSNEWRNETTLFQSALTVCPLNAKVHYNLGKVTVNKSLSLNYYKEAIKLNPEYDQAMNNLANLLKDYGNLDEAEELLRKSIKLRPTFAAAWMNLGIVLSNKKHYSEAEYCFMEAIKHRKHYPDCYYNLGNLYLDQKRYNEAGAAWRKAISQKTTHSVAWNNLVIMLDSIGKYEEAESTAMEALYVLPTDAGIHFNLANSLGKLSRFSEAEKHFKIAIELNPNQALYYVNLGVLYHRWKKYDNAKEAYKKALEINPELVSAERNLKMLL